MIESLVGSAAKAAARAAVERAKGREAFLRQAGYRCPSCRTDRVPQYRAPREKLTFSMWLRGGLIGWLMRKVTKSELACPACGVKPDLSPWLAGTEFATDR